MSKPKGSLFVMGNGTFPTRTTEFRSSDPSVKGGAAKLSEDGEVVREIRAKLEAAFQPEHLAVLDESESHRGHAGFREGGQTHFRVDMKAAAFSDMSRLQRHRAVHNALGPDLIGRIHALALNLSA